MRALLSLFLVLLLSACGGDDAGTDSHGAAGAPESIDAWTESVQLTDAMMDDFFAVAEDMRSVEDDPAKGLAVMAEHGWDMERWTWVAGQLALAIQAETISDSRGDIERGFEQMEAKMELLRKRVAAATGDERKAFARELEQYESIYEVQKKTLAPMLEGAAKNTERNRAILQKYRARWEALGE